MYTTAITAYPLPYSKPCDTSRPRVGQGAATRTGLGGKTFAHFLNPCAMPNGLVRELSSKGRPGCVTDAFCHLGLGKLAGRHVADRDVVELTHDTVRELVQEVISGVLDAGVNAGDLTLLAGALRFPELCLHRPEVARIVDGLAGAQYREALEAQVDTDAGIHRALGHIGDFNHDVQKPVSPAVTGKVRAVLDFAVRQGAGVEHPEGVAGKSERIALALEFTALEGNPAQRLVAPVAQERPLLLGARLDVLLAHGVDRAGVQSKLLAAARCELVQIESGMPATAKTQGIFLPVITEIPDEVAGPALLVKQAGERLHPVSVNQDHFCFFRKSSMARRISSATETSSFFDSSCNRSKAGSGRKKCVRFIPILYTQIQQPDSFAAALYLPGLKAGVSREVN